jgi:hypothetical protein
MIEIADSTIGKRCAEISEGSGLTGVEANIDRLEGLIPSVIIFISLSTIVYTSTPLCRYGILHLPYRFWNTTYFNAGIKTE